MDVETSQETHKMHILSTFIGSTVKKLNLEVVYFCKWYIDLDNITCNQELGQVHIISY